MSDLDHAQVLIEAARRDLRALGGMGDAEIFADEVLGFHAEQAVEKALKAWCAARGIRFALRHDLGELVASPEHSGVDVALCRAFVALQPFAVRYRYEDLDECSAAIDRPALAAAVSGLVRHVAEEIGTD